MSSAPDDSLIETIRLYRETLASLRDLYSDSGKLIGDSYSWLVEGSSPDAAAIARQMEDLHQGLVMKVYAAAAPGLRAGAMHRRQLGRVTLEHIWGTTVMGSRLQEAIDWLIQESEKFRWQDLVRPFAELPPLREKWGELETLVMRLATLITTADGQRCTGDNVLLATMQHQLQRLADAAPEKFVADAKSPRDALVWLREEAKRLRQGAAVAGAETSTRSADGSAIDGSLSAAVAHDGFAGPDEERREQTAPPRAPAAAPAEAGDPAPQDIRTAQQRLAEARGKLDELIGLDAIKASIQTLTNFLKMQQQRAEQGLPATTPSLHMAFVGNPGTGKTSVARIIAEIYGALGVLEKGHLVETDRSGLVAEYAGQTGPKTHAKIDEALDGVLFIDEAYTLIDQSGQDQYGREAVQTLLKRMEDQRERLIVILAGYTDEMDQMIRSNPGLSSRVGTTMHFDDYSPEELCRIFDLIASKAKYELPTQSRRRLLRGFTFLYATRDRHFGNGRTARNSFERSVKRLADRLSKLTEVTRTLLTTLEPEDIEVAGVAPSHLDVLAREPGHVKVTCPHSGKTMLIDDSQLGTEVQSEHCDKTFFADWGTPVLLATDEPPAVVKEESQ